MNPPKKILIADDHYLIRSGVRQMISEIDGIVLVAEAVNGKEAIDLFRIHKPDILLLDISLPDMNGLAVTKTIRDEFSDARIIILSMHNDGDYITKAVDLGVMGYVIKNESGEEILFAIRSLLEGKQYFSRSAQDVIFKQYTLDIARKNRPEAQALAVTKRELDILKLMADGLTSGQIANQLFISTRTVETHRANLMKKFDAKNAIELLKKIQERKLMQGDQIVSE